MNSNQRRQSNRKWRQQNKSEIQNVLLWLQKAPDYAVVDVSSEDIKQGILQARPPAFSAFGSRFTGLRKLSLTKSEWVQFLSEKGVHVPSAEP